MCLLSKTINRRYMKMWKNILIGSKRNIPKVKWSTLGIASRRKVMVKLKHEKFSSCRQIGLKAKKNGQTFKLSSDTAVYREINGSKTSSVRHYISSFETNAEPFGEIIRGHWSVENRLHWMLCSEKMTHEQERIILRWISMSFAKLFSQSWSKSLSEGRASTRKWWKPRVIRISFLNSCSKSQCFSLAGDQECLTKPH